MLCAMAGAAVFVFMAVLVVGVVAHLLISTDKDVKVSDPPRPTNHTNENVTFANLQIDAKDDQNDVQVAGEDEGGLAATSAVASRRCDSRRSTSMRGRPKSTISRSTRRRRGPKEDVAKTTSSSKHARRPNASDGSKLVVIFPRRKTVEIVRRLRYRLPTPSRQPGRFIVSRRRRQVRRTTTMRPPGSAPAARLREYVAEATTRIEGTPQVLMFTTAVVAARTTSTLCNETASPPSGEAFVDFFGPCTQLNVSQTEGDSSLLTSMGYIQWS
ncbi:hypothetical protein MTO96_038004 [Rhipicephalus appendiculatus]